MCKDSKQFLLLVGMFLCTGVLTAAQTPVPHAAYVVPAQERIATATATVLTAPGRSLAGSLLRPETPDKFDARFRYLSEAAYDRDQGQGIDHLEALSQWREVHTLFSTHSSLPLVHFWGGRLQFDGFTSAPDIQNVQLGPSAAGGLLDFRPRRQDYPSEPRSITLYGLSLSFHLGRNAQIGRPPQVWRSLKRMVRAVR